MAKSGEPSAELTRGPASPQGQPLPDAFAIGTVLGGKYLIERVVGGGGMGIIVAARHLALDQWVAIKFLRPDVLRDAETVARFAREARAAVRIRSEHVAHVLDVGEAGDGTPFMVMELLEGHTMADELARRGQVPIEEAVDYVLQLCEALAEAHAAGIVHRDLKPENLFLVHRGDEWRTLKVLDFGISKTALTDSPYGVDMLLTQTLSMMGSPLYMSPEQIRATKNVDHRADIWSVGIVLYELLAGRAAYQAGSITQLCVHVLEERPQPLLELVPNAPPELEEIVDRCLEKDVNERYQNVAELAIDLLPFAPRSARASVERIVSVVRTARMNRRELTVPGSTSPPLPNEASSSAVNVSWAAAPPASGVPRRRKRRSLHPIYAFSAGICVATLATTLGAFAWYRASRRASAPPLALSAQAASPGPAEPAPPPPEPPAEPPAAVAPSRPPAAPRPQPVRGRASVAPRASASAPPRKPAAVDPPKPVPDLGY
ncbi:MAG TPA: serine/threonine-protein kinase [Polyangiaceae bacterium]|nr:serine/threonine-protein kinase [Polyangiaceae bacterium]